MHNVYNVGYLINIQYGYMAFIILIYFILHNNISSEHKEQHKSKGSVLFFKIFHDIIEPIQF